MQFRDLTPDELECRWGTVNANGASVLIYKTSRADMKVLDETYGPNNWQTDFCLIGTDLYCKLQIWDSEKKQWIQKMDVGIESRQTDGNERKAAASDALKRAAFQAGIGRALYTAPFIWLKVKTKNDGKRWVIDDKVYPVVADIEYEGETISYLVITNGQKGETLYAYGKSRLMGEAQRLMTKQRIEGAQHV